MPAERVTWRYFWRRPLGSQSFKVIAFDEMGDAANLTAELEFVALSLTAGLLREGRALLRGRWLRRRSNGEHAAGNDHGRCGPLTRGGRQTVFPSAWPWCLQAEAAESDTECLDALRVGDFRRTTTRPR